MIYIDHIKGYLSRAALLLLMAGGALMAGCEDFLAVSYTHLTLPTRSDV